MKTTAKKSAKPAKKSTPQPARRLEDIARGRAGCFPITPTLIQPEPGFNSREDLGDLRALAADIQANGLQQPLKIRKEPGTENIYLIDGHRRHASITRILIPQGRWPQDKDDPSLPAPVECTSEKRGTKPIDRLFMQLSMNTGKPFTFLEEAHLYQRILREDVTLKPADIARRTGKTKQAISDSLRLVNDGCALLLENVRHGILAATTAVQIIKQAGPGLEEQEALLSSALAHAHSTGRSNVTPKDLTEKPAATPEPTPDPSDPSDQPSSLESSSLASCVSDSPVFSLYVIPDAPEDPIATDSPFYHETDRFVLESPGTFGLARLHLLCAATPFGPAFGYRVDDHEHLPDVSAITLNSDPQEGFNTVLEFACRHAQLSDEYQSTLRDLLYDALCAYFPEEGTPQEPKTLAFVPIAGASNAKSEEPTGYQSILNAPSSGGGTGGGGGSSYLDPQTFKAVQKIEKILEDLADKDKGIPERVTTADILVAVLRNERPASELKNYLLGR